MADDLPADGEPGSGPGPDPGPGPGDSPVPGPRELMGMLQGEGGFEEIMLQPVFPSESGGRVSQAAVVADIVNILRLDAMTLAASHDVDVQVDRITERKMGHLLCQLVEGNPGPLIDVFDKIEDLHHEVLSEVMDDEAFTNYVAEKQAMLYTHGYEDNAPSDQ